MYNYRVWNGDNRYQTRNEWWWLVNKDCDREKQKTKKQVNRRIVTLVIADTGRYVEAIQVQVRADLLHSAVEAGKRLQLISCNRIADTHNHNLDTLSDSRR